MPANLEMVFGVSVVLLGINVLLMRSLGLVYLAPLASPDAIHLVCLLIVVPLILE